MHKFAETLVRLVYPPPPLAPLSQQYLSKDKQHLNMQSEADRRLTFEKWPVAFSDKNKLAETGFHYTDHSDVVCCAYCVAQIGLWQEGDDAFKEHQRWSPNCEFIRGLSVGNINIGFLDSLPHRPSSLLEAVTCVVIILSIDPIHIQNGVSILACFILFLSVQLLLGITNFQPTFLLRLPEYISTQ